MKRLFVTLAAASVLAMSVFAGTFEKKLSYTDGMFSDVKGNAWYAKEVASAYELGFMNGTGANVFSPDGNVTVAQGITMAARVNASYNGKGDIANSTTGNWYDNAVKYAVDNGIITDGQFDSYTRNITRAEMGVLFANAVPENEFAAKNDVKFIPDVNITADYADDLLVLYKAGIVMGSDAYGTFNPDADIKRSEVAAIINRVAIPENRLSKTLKEYTVRDAYQLVYNAGDYTTSLVTGKTGTHESLDSGWVYDNRGGTPRLSIEETFSVVTDISETEGAALIKEVNKTEGEKLVAEFSCAAYGNGAYVEFRDENEKSVYCVKVVDGKWSVLRKDGKFSPVAQYSEGGYDKFRIYLDQDTGKAKIYINNMDCGETELLSDNILNFRYAVDEESKTHIKPSMINIVANYGVYEIFDTFGIEEIYGWKKNGIAQVKDGELVLAGKSDVIKPFEAIDTKYIAEMLAIFPKGENAGFKVMSGDKSAVELKSENGKLYANGTIVYEKLTQNMWYRLRVEANPSAGKADIVINGRTLGTVVLNTTSPADTLVISSQSGNVKFDDIKVYANADHHDYVPVPEMKADFDDYIVGLNVCSLWRDNGTHFGWACITPYDENRPVLGYYDEGSVECADWEIKFMVEHGIDVQALCWYPDVTDGPIKSPRNGYQLNDALQHAKYQDYMKYCIIMECGSKYTLDNFRKYIVPYWFENYFLDENYFTLDNKIVIDMFGTSSLKSTDKFGSAENLKKELEYVNEKAKEYGFDGAIFISNDTPTALADYGIGYRTAYHWLSAGSEFEANRDMNIGNNLASDKVYQIPTISMGYNDLAWVNDTGRKPLMTVEDYNKCFTWLKDEYLPTYAKKGTWEEKLVWLSTWNEYGEGTYIMPSGLNEFGYLDVLRKHFTDLPSDHDDEIPTQEQGARINRLYPQYARYLRRQQTFEYNSRETVYEVAERYDMNAANISLNKCSDIKFTDDGVTATSNAEDFQVNLKALSSKGLSLKNICGVRVHAKVPAGNAIQIYYGTAESAQHAESKSIRINTTTSEMTTYDFDFSSQAAWQGELTSLRLDPSNGTGITFTIKAIEFLRNKTEADYQKRVEESPKLYINGVQVKSAIFPENKANKLLFAFDPETSMHNLLHTYMTWNHDEKTLTLEADGHKVTFTVGSDKYIVDGNEKSLGYTLYMTDGLPMLCFETLSDALGFDYKFDKTANRADVETDEKNLYEQIVNTQPGTWEFNSYEPESWSSSRAAIMPGEHYITFDNRASGYADPSMFQSTRGMGFKAQQYPKMEIRVRYKYDTSDVQSSTIYFITDKDTEWNEKKAVWVKQNSAKESDGWETYTFDMTSKGTWKDKITALRFDPFNTVGSMDIDYIRFIPNPDYVDFESTNGILNGDAENTGIVTFYSMGAAITNVQDDKDTNNRVYNVKGPNSKAWSYFIHDYPFESGKTYKFSYDVRAIPDSRGISTDIKIATNIRYYEEGKEGVDHVIAGHDVPKDGSWVHVEDTFTVGKMSSDLRQQVSIYANPTSDTSSACYQVDNIKVETVK